MKWCIVFQGPLYAHCMETLCKTVAIVPNCIISTWTSENPDFIQQLRSAGAHEVIQSEKPTHAGAQNFNYMTFSTTVGINRAEELGFTHLLRFRTDYTLSDFHKFMDLCESMDHTKLIFMCWFTFHNYLMDYFQFGPINLMRQFYSTRRPIDDNIFNHERCNEFLLQETFFQKKPVEFEDTLTICNFIIKKAIDSNIELYCIKNEINKDDLFKHFINNAFYN